MSSMRRRLTLVVLLLGTSTLTGTSGCWIRPNCSQNGTPCQVNSECCSSNCPKSETGPSRCE